VSKKILKSQNVVRRLGIFKSPRSSDYLLK